MLRQWRRMKDGFFRNGEITGHSCSVTTPQDMMLRFLRLPVPLKHVILISVSEVSSIDYQNRKWADMTVNYQIGQVDFPASSDVQ